MIALQFQMARTPKGRPYVGFITHFRYSRDVEDAVPYDLISDL